MEKCFNVCLTYNSTALRSTFVGAELSNSQTVRKDKLMATKSTQTAWKPQKIHMRTHYGIFDSTFPEQFLKMSRVGTSEPVIQNHDKWDWK
jgi:hypothetical protein